ncbi:uncharacterized protein RAG0_01732 [Rhynchosporium agropyri]|uniref:Guanine nucleotide-exchange factor SEC12 n=1 Tax=Rhynchosporium agropyri TaxID=914238 RepID=A0A1E1JY44_9HELO|nr:uncharacterized protein RAG0_01732 [Rhynchosporium agropyri]
MAPLIPSAKATLSYPLYAVDFDPLDSTRLLVGGGGGAGRTGVGNKITLLDTSNPNELTELRDIELSKDEDNVTSLAVGVDTDGSPLVFAGVNSSPADVEKGQNKHFRVFRTDASASAKRMAAEQEKSADQITEVSRSALFEGRESDIYQRITRLSKPFQGQPQLGAVATGLSKAAEIVLFDTTSTISIRKRGALQSNKEAVDVDFIQTGPEEYFFAYCDEHDIYIKKIGAKTDAEEPECIYVTPATRGDERPTTPKFRAMRFLSKEFVVMLTNIASNSGVCLQVFRVPKDGKGEARLAQSIRLPYSVTKATALAVANLTPPASPTAPQGYTQFVVAVAGHDISISLFKIDLQVEGAASLISKIKPFRTFKNVHPLQITGLAFSNYTPSTGPVTAQTPPQVLKLASVGVSNTVVVHTIPLFPVPLSVKRGQSKTPRYVVALPSSAAVFSIEVILGIIGIALASIIVQAIFEVRGTTSIYLNARNHLPRTIQEHLGRPYEFPRGYKPISSSNTPIADSIVPEVNVHPTGVNHHIGVPLDPVVEQKGADPLVLSEEDSASVPLPVFFEQLQLQQAASRDNKPIILREIEGERNGKASREVEVHVHDEEKHGQHDAKLWEELPKHQKEGWKKMLSDAGHWAEEMGETVLKGVLFSELGGLVGDAVRGQ